MHWTSCSACPLMCMRSIWQPNQNQLLLPESIFWALLWTCTAYQWLSQLQMYWFHLLHPGPMPSPLQTRCTLQRQLLGCWLIWHPVSLCNSEACEWYKVNIYWKKRTKIICLLCPSELSSVALSCCVLHALHETHHSPCSCTNHATSSYGGESKFKSASLVSGSLRKDEFRLGRLQVRWLEVQVRWQRC